MPGIVPAASGYRLYSALQSPIFAKSLISRYYPSTVSGQITCQDIVPSEIKNQGDTVVFRRAPVAEIFDYQKNQDLEVSQLNTRPDIMTIDRAKYYNLKLDEIDEKQIGDIRTWVSEFRDSAVNLMAQQIDYELFTELPHQVDCHNKGPRAGARTGIWDLGTQGAPVTLNATNIHEVLGRLATVLTETNAPMKDRWIILPTAAQALFWMNPILANACASGNGKSIILSDGEMFPNILGFNIIFSNILPIYTDPVTGQQTYVILAGLGCATGFVMQLNKQEIIDKDPRSFSKYWRGLNLYGFKVLRPENLAALYATLDFTPPAV